MLLHILSELCAHLEALTDVRIYRSGPPILTNDTVLSEMKDAIIRIKPNAQNVQNSAFGQVLTVAPPAQNYALIWINYNTTKNQFTHLKGKVEIILSELLLERPKSNGLPCNLNIFQAQMGDITMALKFREINRKNENEKFSENEGNKAMKTEHDERIRQLFPKLYCMVDFYNEAAALGHWEAIGTEILANFNENDLRNTRHYTQCFDLLQQLHRAGYAHGDSHGGNFMKNAEQTYRLIDQDELMVLPQERPTITKFLKILDFTQLLFWNNPHCSPFYDIRKEQQYSREFHKAYFNSPKHEIFLIPYGYAYYRHNNNWDHIELLLKHDPKRKQGQTYWMYIERLSMDWISDFLFSIFDSFERMHNIQTGVESLAKGIPTSSFDQLYVNA